MRGLVVLLLASSVALALLVCGSVGAQEESFLLSLARDDGHFCDAIFDADRIGEGPSGWTVSGDDESCPEPWVDYHHDTGTARGKYCESRIRFCETFENECMCGTQQPLSYFVRTLEPGSAAPDVVDSEAEIIEHVVDECYLDGIRHRDDATLFGDEQQTLEVVKSLSAEAIREMIDAVRPLVVGQDRATRMAVYEVAAATCVQATRDVAR